MPYYSQDIGLTNGTAITVKGNLWTMVLRGVDCSGYLTTRMRIKTTLPPAASTANNNETNQYFYHSDHLGSSSFVSDAIGYATQHLQYLPYGETFVDQHGAFDSRYTFSAKEKDDETQYSYFGARYYDSDLSVWLSVDPMADKYPNESPFAYVSNNPVVFIDEKGNDKVYFDCNGNEVKRVKSNKIFETYVQTGTRTFSYAGIQVTMPIYEKAPMPGVVKGYENPKYQKLDYQIAASVFIFNQKLKNKDDLPQTINHQVTKNTQTPLISPDLIKAMILVESTMGQPGPNGTGDTDPMQSNYPGDWNGSYDVKTAVGLSKNQEMTPKTSIDAGIGILFLKGIISDNMGNYTSWRGGYEAVARYHRIDDYNYAEKVFNYYNLMLEAKPENYVEP